MPFYSTLSEQVLHILRDDIIQGALKPGSRLNEQELADRYKVSRTPLREAIRQLQMEGLVEATPNKGAWVAFLSVADIRDYFEVRRVMEGYAVHLICKQISDTDIQRLKKTVTALKDNYYVANHMDNYRLMTDYYGVLHTNCPNSHLRQTLESMTRRFSQLRFVMVQARSIIKLFEMYGVLVELLERREAVEAEKYFSEALKMSQEIMFTEVLKAYPNIVRN